MPAFLAPLAVSAVASFIPSVISALAGSKTPEEAARLLGPMREAKVAQLVSGGMRRDEALAQVDEGMQGEIQAKMQEGALPPWAEMALGLAAGAAGGVGAIAAKGGMSAVKGLIHPFSKKLVSKPGTNLGKLGVDKPPVKLDRSVVQAGLPKERVVGVNDGIIDAAEESLMIPFPKPAPRVPSLRNDELARIMSANPQGY